MDLPWLQSRLERRIASTRSQIGAVLSGAKFPLNDARTLHELEGILSTTWQAWNRYCRSVVINSCLGCNGRTMGPIAATHTEEESVAYIAKHQNSGKLPKTTGKLSLLRFEPTWGDMAKVLEIIAALSPTNSAQLLSAFGTAPRIAHLQHIRNATAHRNQQAMLLIYSWQSAYLATRIRHPLEALFWKDPSTGSALVHARLDEMSLAAQIASC